MKIILHILLKDLRRHRWEILLFLAVVAGWAWEIAHPNPWVRQHAQTALPIAFFGIWIFLAIRLIHGEVLVGDREFWTTRPYRGWQLLAAKLFCLLLCTNLPFVLAQVYLLHHAKIPLSAHLIPGFLIVQLFYLVICTFPVVVLASITESIVQWVLWILGLILFVITMTWLPWSKLPVTFSATENLASSFGATYVGGALLAVLLCQFLRRRIWWARILFGLAVILVPLTIPLASRAGMRDLAYPQSSSPALLRLSALDSYTSNSYSKNDMSITLPVKVQLPSDSAVRIEGMRVHFSDAHGEIGQSGWTITSLEIVGGMDQGRQLKFDFPKALRGKLDQGSVDVSADLLVSVYKLHPAQRVETNSEKFVLPGNIYCHWQKPQENGEFRTSTFLSCLVPFDAPDLVVTRLKSEDVNCAADEEYEPLPVGHIASEAHWGGSGDPNIDPNPVHVYSINFGAWNPALFYPDENNKRQERFSRICPGTPFSMQTGEFVSHERLRLDLGRLGKEEIFQKKTESANPDPDE